MASLPPSLPPTVNAEFVLRDHMNPLVKVNLSPCLHSRALRWFYLSGVLD